MNRCSQQNQLILVQNVLSTANYNNHHEQMLEPFLSVYPILQYSHSYQFISFYIRAIIICFSILYLSHSYIFTPFYVRAILICLSHFMLEPVLSVNSRIITYHSALWHFPDLFTSYKYLDS